MNTYVQKSKRARLAGMPRTLVRVLSLALVFALICGGCAGLDAGGDLFALPKVAGFVEQLQTAIDDAMADGGEYSAPLSGTNRQSVQLEDLNGDGAEEAILFLRTTETLKMCVFEEHGGSYFLSAEAEGEGVSFDSVSYADLSGDGIKEILLGRSLGSGIPKALSVLTLGDDGFRQMLTATYSGYTQLDIDSDGDLELVIARHDLEPLSGVAEVYSYSHGDGALLLEGSADLSDGISALRRLRTGYLPDGSAAVFIIGTTTAGDTFTDICAYSGDAFLNLTLDPETGISREVVATFDVNAADINGDGVFDLPMPVLLATYENKASSEVFRKVVWRNYSLDGSVGEVMQTFHSGSDGWYFVLPDEWQGAALAVDRRSAVSGERVIAFSLVSQETGEAVPLLELYTLTGDNRENRSTLSGRFIISNSQTRTVASTIYAGKLNDLTGTAYERYALTPEQVSEAFKLIQTEWLTGELTN